MKKHIETVNIYTQVIIIINHLINFMISNNVMVNKKLAKLYTNKFKIYIKIFFNRLIFVLKSSILTKTLLIGLFEI